MAVGVYEVSVEPSHGCVSVRIVLPQDVNTFGECVLGRIHRDYQASAPNWIERLLGVTFDGKVSSYIRRAHREVNALNAKAKFQQRREQEAAELAARFAAQ